MPFSGGDRLGPYEILAPLGAGGMGEVFKARDTRLDRTVAVKVLPEHIAKRDDLRARFEREARAVASLNHPNICTLHDIGSQDGAGYMVMELIEGETLADRIAKGALPLEQALKFAIQIADALDRAHRAGVTHRDVKPQNIMLTRDGVKVLDFGLAKSTASKPGPTEETLTKVLTTEGTVMGTPQYMAPEQFAGKEADARSDIWAFGAVLYEMVTGRKAFQGSSYQSLVGAILATDPAPMAVKPFTPSWLERLVRRCLAKEPEDRWQTMRDVVIELRSPPAENVATPAKASRWPWAIAAAMLALGALIGWALSRSRHTPAPVHAQRFHVLPPEGGQIDLIKGFALSPDGQTLAFVATAPGGSGLWLRPMDGAAPRLMPGTEQASFPFWSPDSRSVAYGASGKLWRLDVAGGTPVAVCDMLTTSAGDWSPDGFIVFQQNAGLLTVPASGGIPEQLTRPDAARGEIRHAWPQSLPSGRILFSVEGKEEGTAIYVTTRANPRERIRLVPSNSNGLYAAGHLFWLRGATLVAQHFDPQRLILSGEPRALAEPIGLAGSGLGGYGKMSVAASSSGLLVHGHDGGMRFHWVNRAGSATGSTAMAGTLGRPGSYGTFRLSPDGRRVAIQRGGLAGRGLWLADLERDSWIRFTFMAGPAYWPLWSPDGKLLVFQAGAPLNLYRKEANGAGTEQRLIPSARTQWPTDWSRDGRLLLYYEESDETQRDIWVLPVTADGKPEAAPRPYLRTRFNELSGRFFPEPSPRWIAYASNESGRPEVYVQGFPEPRGKFQISTGGGELPDWSSDGRELFYVSLDRKLMSVRVDLHADSVTPSAPRELFSLPPGILRSYAVAPDGQRFLVPAPAGGAQPLEVIVNWPALLKGAAKE